MPIRQPRPPRFHSLTTIRELTRSPLLGDLTKAALVVYLKILAATPARGRRRVAIHNADLHHTPRTAIAMVKALEKRGLVRLHYGPGSARIIEVL